MDFAKICINFFFILFCGVSVKFGNKKKRNVVEISPKSLYSHDSVSSNNLTFSVEVMVLAQGIIS